MARVKDIELAYQGGSDSIVVATWDFTTYKKTDVDYYLVAWHYYTGDGFGYEGESQQVSQSKNSLKLNTTYTPPSNANHVRANIKPVAKKDTVNGKEKSRFTGAWRESSAFYLKSYYKPDKLDTPTVSIGSSSTTDSDGNNLYKMTAELQNIDDSSSKDVNNTVDYVEYRFYKSNTQMGIVYSHIGTHRATATTYVSPGGKYRARARGINNSTKISSSDKQKIVLDDGTKVTLSNAVYGDWSDYTDYVYPPPDKPSNLAASADSENVIKLTWTKADGADGYEVQYAKQKEYLQKSSNEVSSQSIDTNTNTTYIEGLETGQEWFFRLRATNSYGNSGWTDIVSCIIGTTPEAPTTWSSISSAMIGEIVNLYWVHNCEDGSDQSAAEISLILNGDENTAQTIVITGDTREYALDTSGYEDSTEITWRVRTKGIMPDYGEWSTSRLIKVNAPATLAIELRDVNGNNIEDNDDQFTSFPLIIVADAGPKTQTPVSYYVAIYSTESYETVGPNGETVIVSAGDEIYYKLYNTSESDIEFTVSVGDVTFECDKTYKVVVTVSMNSGQTAETESMFTVSWDEALYEPEAGLAFDFDNYSAYITPYCYADYEPEDPYESPDDYPPPEYQEGLTLSVYRREYDGTFTLIGDGIENTGISTITDPHPGLDYARYRIVAQDDATGQISYEDIPGFPVNSEYVIFQWNEDWSNFEYDGEEEFDEPTWSGSMIQIRGNIDISETNNPDVALVEYIGRENPVSYYGTQIGETTTWNTDIDKSDAEMVYQLRRLKRYMGDVYVRNPSGVGYWAQVGVSMNINHSDTVIPVTFNITRVEGGI